MATDYCVDCKTEKPQKGGKYCSNNHFVCKSSVNNKSVWSTMKKCPVCDKSLK